MGYISTVVAVAYQVSRDCLSIEIF